MPTVDEADLITTDIVVGHVLTATILVLVLRLCSSL